LTDRGTLIQLKNDFGHRGVTCDVTNSFNHVENFVRFVTKAHVANLALKLCGLADVNSTPTTDSGSLDETAQQIVDEVWLLPPISDVANVLHCAIQDDFMADNWRTCDEGMSFALLCFAVYT